MLLPESKEIVNDTILEQEAKVLKVPTEAIKNFDEERAINFISTTFQDHSIACVNSYVPAFNPIDKIVELYEALVKSEKEKVEMPQKLLSERNYNCFSLLN